ncbi:MAG: DUF6132 family protein [Sedimentisphaerales bacterium]|jgi:thioredoxin 1|nr:DUF6132 family protein [Sedimentisphaerales bacterium]HNY76913.1 DUF6132 family protein [Sedimentisphaerales bacterium]HOC62767.1 DUF6132 family protein [Sedimentisphaerales bacterium]HOH62687.1 DUF6132 family protein [Sedimentisphaerales bacterium]HPY51293.1 DUF6132 family protein [Sedimentisphaerales bacterium]
MPKTLIIQLALGLLIGGGLGAVMGYYGKCSSGACPLTANPCRGAFLGALIGGVIAYSGAGSRVNPEGKERGYAAMQIETLDDFERFVLKAEQPVMVDFHSNGCPPCRKLAPTVEELAEEYQGRAIIAKVNVDRVPELARRYGIQDIPAVLFFGKGAETHRLVGLRPRSAYTEVLEGLLG